MIIKLSLRIFVPAVGEAFDFLVPSSMRVATAATLIANILRDSYPGIQVHDKSLKLMRVSDQRLLNPEYAFTQMEILNGTELLIV